MVLIGSARIDENGNISGGKSGDQTGKEVCVEEWYLHKQGWVIIRAKRAEVRHKIAQDMLYICDNDNVGYSQTNNMSLFYASEPYGFNASKVNVACDTDCAKAVLVAVRYAGIICDVFYTGNEISVLEATGEFEIIRDEKYTTNCHYLLEGDILVTPTKGHTVVVLSNGDYMNTYYYSDSREAGTYKVTAYALNLRIAPNTDADVICTMSYDDEVYCYGVCAKTDDRLWLYIQHGEERGFASTKYLERV